MTTAWKGLGVALATPFVPGDGVCGTGGLDIEGFRKIVRNMVSGGADFLVVLGSTGEAATVTEAERDILIKTTKEESGGLPVCVGVGHNSTAQVVAWARRAEELGADGLLVVVPYYNKPQAAGIVAHFNAVAKAVPGMPIIAYNVPGRTGINLLPKDLAELWKIDSVIAVKESSGNLAQIGEIARTLPAGKSIFSGDDALALQAIAVGAAGLISVVGNILPAETKALVEAARAGKFGEARTLHNKLLPVMDAMFLESNPAPLKAALSIMGTCADAIRLPLVPVAVQTRSKVAEALDAFKGNR